MKNNHYTFYHSTYTFKYSFYLIDPIVIAERSFEQTPATNYFCKLFNPM